MRPFANMDDFFNQIEFFVDSTSGYKADFALFPEFFNAPLLMEYNELPEPEAIRKLAEKSEVILKRFIDLAVSYNINIITGSMPLLKEDGRLYNMGYLIRRDGSHEQFEKIHITPSEERFWGLVGGDKVTVFDTDSGKVGILICYDVEFPELGRILAEQGMQILFVPFLTDTQNAYSRVRNCAMARAIENECFVAIAGCVGNLPKVANMDIQFAQSAVFTPCDFAFPTNGIKGETTPNTEMVLVVDVDLDLLKELHSFGSVRNLQDRRNDLYKVKYKKGIDGSGK
jgi:predicted amidohydrolase